MRRPWTEVVGVVLGLLLVLVLAQFWSRAVLAAPILLALAAVPSTALRLRRRAEGRRLAQRVSGAAVWVALAAVLVDAVPAAARTSSECRPLSCRSRSATTAALASQAVALRPAPEPFWL